nr:unknown protein [Bacillus subtilis]BAA09034.1 ycsD [Bacillus subtilis]prf//2208409F ORF [Bacillus subtilis]
MNSLSLPHRYPFLFIDGVTDSEPGKHAAAYKLISENDWFITDTQTEMPFSLVIEGLRKPRLLQELQMRTAWDYCLRKRKSWEKLCLVTGLILRLKSRAIGAGLCSDMPRHQLESSLLLKLKSASILKNEKNPSQHFVRGSILCRNPVRFESYLFAGVCVFHHSYFPSALH